MKRVLIPILAIGLLSVAAPSRSAESSDAAHYLDQFVDRGVSPGDDFFLYAVGKWLKDHPIPANERSWGVAKVVQEETYNRLLAINQGAAAGKAPRGSNAQKIGDFWHAAMDTEAIAKQGIAPLKEEFARIGACTDLDGVLAIVGRFQYLGVNSLCSLPIFQDEKNSSRYVLHLYQGGLGLPNRDYYFDSDDRTRMNRTEYVVHVARMFELLGDDSARARANAGTVMAIETELASASRKLEDLRDPHANYNAMSVAGLSALSPTIRWPAFFEAGHAGTLDSVIVGQPEFFQQVEKSLHAHSIDEWKTYLRWNLVNTFADQAGGRFDAQNFHFYGTILNGTPQQRARWKRMLDQEEAYLGDALGQLYVRQYFSPRTKQRYEKLTDEIFQAFRDRLSGLDWMSAATKQRALRKLDSVTKKVGYADRWKDYSTYVVDRNSYLGNCVRGNIWTTEYYVAKLRKPVDRTEWEMTPQTYNAYYNPSNNEIVLPAAAFILPGIPDSLVDDALVYSYAGGTTIGHEITHGFDDQGRQFDDQGNLENWWTDDDAREFNRRAALIVTQYDAYVVVDSLRVNGSATQGENIADLGGMLLGWEAFKKTEQYKSGKSLGGFTPAQRYFIGWALGWMTAIRPENLAVRVKTDVHAPASLRVNGPASNLTPFYEAYGVKPGDRMHRDDSVRVKIW